MKLASKLFPNPLHLQNKLMQDCIKGLAHLHQQKILHRDIKPENILLSQNLDAKLADFGISKFLKLPKSQIKFTNDIGTLGWRSPELIQNDQNIQTNSDIFSLGCIFYYIKTMGAGHPFDMYCTPAPPSSPPSLLRPHHFPSSSSTSLGRKGPELNLALALRFEGEIRTTARCRRF